MPTRTITTTASEFVPRNRLRKSLQLSNDDASIICFGKRERDGATASSTDYDFVILPRASQIFNSLQDGDEVIQDRFTVTAASGTPRVSFVETENVVR